MTHDGLDDTLGHIGDFGNIVADDQGVAHINITSKKVRLDGRYSVLGCVLSFHTGNAVSNGSVWNGQAHGGGTYCMLRPAYTKWCD